MSCMRLRRKSYPKSNPNNGKTVLFLSRTWERPSIHRTDCTGVPHPLAVGVINHQPYIHISRNEATYQIGRETKKRRAKPSRFRHSSAPFVPNTASLFGLVSYNPQLRCGHARPYTEHRDINVGDLRLRGDDSTRKTTKPFRRYVMSCMRLHGKSWTEFRLASGHTPSDLTQECCITFGPMGTSAAHKKGVAQ